MTNKEFSRFIKNIPNEFYVLGYHKNEIIVSNVSLNECSFKFVTGEWRVLVNNFIVPVEWIALDLTQIPKVYKILCNEFTKEQIASMNEKIKKVKEEKELPF
jgi:hypothetical protein